MNELQVNVTQTPGSIEWNFDELKSELKSELEVFKNTEYTDETIKDAKRDNASLRKLRKAVNDRKVEIKGKCLEPYMVIEEQAKELISLIDEPIALIDTKVKDYETRRREARKAKIIEFMKVTFSDLPEDVATKLRFKTYDPRWENATATDKAFKEAVTKAHDDTVTELGLLTNVDDDFRDQVYATYLESLDFRAAMERANFLQKQKEIVLERERKRQEEERIRRERMRMEQEQNIRKREQELTETAEMMAQKPAYPLSEQPAIEHAEPAEKAPEPTVEAKGSAGVTIIFHGIDEQLKKVLGYIKYVGADYEVRR